MMKIRLHVLLLIVLSLFLVSCKKQEPKVTLTFAYTEITLKVSEKITLNPVVENKDNAVIIYEIEDEAIISIVNNEITGLKEGTTKVTALVKDSNADAVELNITVEPLPVPKSITTNRSLELSIGSTHQIEYNVLPEGVSQEVTFTSSDSSVLTVSETGLITCLDLGDAFITIKSVENQKVRQRVDVAVVRPKIEGITCVDELEIGYNESKRLECSIYPEYANQDMGFESLNPEIAIIDDTGLITSLKPGTATIRITALNDETKTHDVKVTVTGTKATSLETVTELNLTLGQKQFVEYTILPQDAFQGLDYEVSDKEGIEITSAGILTALKAGTFNLTLKTIDGTNLSKTITVTVTGPSVPTVVYDEGYSQNQTHSLFSPFSPLDGLRVFDAEDGELTDKLTINGKVKNSEYGKYELDYEVTDKDGNNLHFVREIEVVWDYSVTFIGHAGSLYGAMNSEEAILYSAQVLKYTAIEIDLKQTKDGVFVLSHDETFAGYELGQYNWDFLKDIEVTVSRAPGISGLDKNNSYTAKLCTLARYLEICKEYNITAVIELKTSAGISNWTETNSPESSRMPALIKEIEKAGMINNIIFLTSQYECLAWTRRNGYDFIPCQYLVSTCESTTTLNRCIEYNFDVSFNVRDGIKNSVEWVKKYKDAGLQVSTYTFEQYATYEEVQEWIDKGADFITTDWHDVSKLNLPKKQEN